MSAIQLTGNVFKLETLENNHSFVVSKDSPIRKVIATIKELVARDTLVSDVRVLHVISEKQFEISRTEKVDNFNGVFVVTLGEQVLFSRSARGLVQINMNNRMLHADTVAKSILQKPKIHNKQRSPSQPIEQKKTCVIS